MTDRPRKILLTGAAGGIGRVVLRHFVREGYAVRALDRRIDEGAPSAVEWSVGELTDTALAREAVAGVDAVVHLAAIPNPWSEPDATVYVDNVAATFAVLDAAGQAGIRRAVIASSISIYGIVWAERELAVPEIPLSETSELRIADPYALSKRADEACAEMMHLRYGIDVLAYRFPDVGDTARIAARAADVLADPAVAHRELWAYLNSADAAVALELGLTADVNGAVVVNVVAPDALGGVDVAALAPRFYPQAPCTLPLGRSISGYTTERARRLLGFEAAHRWDGQPFPAATASGTGAADAPGERPR